MDKCPKNMTLEALNIFGLITILDFFQDTFVSIFKTIRPSDYFALLFFLALWRASLFSHFVFSLLAVGHIFLLSFKPKIFDFQIFRSLKIVKIQVTKPNIFRLQ